MSLLLLTVGACSNGGPATGGAGGSTGAGGNSTGTGGSGATGSGGSGATGAGGAGGVIVTGTGGSGGGAAGATGSGGAAGGTTGTIMIQSTDFGAFDNAFMLTPCATPGTGFDCPNPAAGAANCPTTPWQAAPPIGATTEGTGSTYTEVFNVSGGDPTKIYDVTVHVVGQAEGRTYTGGTSALGTAAANPNGVNNLLYTGGRPGTARVDYNVFMLTVAPPAGGQAVAGAPTFFAFNGVDTGHEGQHFNYQLDETFMFKVKSGFTVTLTSHDSNCIAIKNCGNGGPYGFSSATQCEAQARTVPGVTLPTTFRGTTLANQARQPFQTQFVNFKVTGIVAE
jgi:hypothetical protein